MEAVPSTSCGVDEAEGSENNDISRDESDGHGDDSSDNEETVKCPICLLKIKGQTIGLPDVCGHPFCLDCILEWSKLSQTCPYDRRPFTNILVKSKLEGELVRVIPVIPVVENNDFYVFDDALEGAFIDEEQAAIVLPFEFNEHHQDECQICGMVERPNVMLFCHTCDHGYHMNCLNPPLENFPTENWFCRQCNVILAPPQLEQREVENNVILPPEQREIEIEAVVRPQMEIVEPDMRQPRGTIRPVVRQLDRNGRDLRTVVRLIVERNRQQMIAFNNSIADVERVVTTVYDPRLPDNFPVVTRKRRQKISSPRRRKRTQSHKSFGLQREPTSAFSLFGNSNSLDEPDNDNDDETVHVKFNTQLCPPKKEEKSAIARLAERRKVKRPISYGHLVRPSTTPTKPAVPSAIYTGNCDLIGSIMASQSKLKDFGKTNESLQRNYEDSNSNRMRAAIIASRAILDRFDEDRKNRKIALNGTTDYEALKNFRIPKLPKCQTKEEKSSSQNLSPAKSSTAIETSPSNQRQGRKSENMPDGEKKKMLEKLEGRRKRMAEKLRSGNK